MRKLDQEISANETISFPSCKTFVFLRSEYPVSFKFITLFNRIDRTIENFQDSFSVTADTYFLRVEITSKYAQTLSCILIEDTKIEYTPITGDVFISNDESHKVPVSGIIENSGGSSSINETIPVLQPRGHLLHISQGGNFDKFPTYYTNYYLEHFFSSYITSSADATKIYACSINSASFSGSKFFYLTEIKITPDVDCNLCLFIISQTSGFMNSYDLTIYENFYKNVVYENTPSGYLRLMKKTVLFSDIENNEILYEKIPLKAGEEKIVNFHTPILLDTRSSWNYQPKGYFTICTDIPAQYNLFCKCKYYQHEYFVPTYFT